LKPIVPPRTASVSAADAYTKRRMLRCSIGGVS
jgi:hypothetical protein